MIEQYDQQSHRMPTVTIAALLVAVLAIWAIVSTMDYNDAQRAEIEYCQHVRDGLWPDWKGTYKPDCEGEVEL